jgi:polyisoprenoid-binding protein YceI
MTRIRRLACVLGALAVSVLAAGATPAFATLAPPPATDSNHPAVSGQVTTHLVTASGMPGWQITLIAAAAALAAATLTVIIDRAHAAHRQAPTRTA